MNFFCPNKNCTDFGKRNNGNIGVKDHYGKPEQYCLYAKLARKVSVLKREAFEEQGEQQV